MEDEKIVKKETTDWGSWGACDATCGFGIRSRSRIVEDVPISDQDRCYQQECVGHFSFNSNSFMQDVRTMSLLLLCFACLNL